MQETPFRVEYAPRVHRLPPYLFGRINNLLYQKRRAGQDVIDMGMGNPSDPPDPLVIEKLSEAASDVRNHGYSKSNGILNLRRELTSICASTALGLIRKPRPSSVWGLKKVFRTCCWR